MSELKKVNIDYKLVPIQNVSPKLREKCYQLLKYTFRDHFKEKLVLTVLKPFKLYLEFELFTYKQTEHIAKFLLFL